MTEIDDCRENFKVFLLLGSTRGEASVKKSFAGSEISLEGKSAR